MRAVGVNQLAGCRWDLDVGGCKACASRGLRLSALADQHSAG